MSQLKRLNAPYTEAAARDLRVGDMVLVTGIVMTGRDAIHKWLSQGNDIPSSFGTFRESVIYHCGPVVMKKKGKWVVTAAGPTTSMREEPYQAGIIERFSLRAVIGKGGMGEKTRLACEKFGCVYLHAIGGAAQVLAEAVEEVEDVYGIEEFGSPEAVWKLRVKEFPAVVTIDAHGNSLHRDIQTASQAELTTLLAAIKPSGSQAS